MVRAVALMTSMSEAWDGLVVLDEGDEVEAGVRRHLDAASCAGESSRTAFRGEPGDLAVRANLDIGTNRHIDTSKNLISLS